MPTRFKTKLKYCTPITVTSGTGTCGAHVFSANGLFDPDVTGAGHQPRGFDQLISMYDHYVVARSAIRLCGTTYNATTSAYAPANVGICVRDAGATETVPYEYIEQGWNKWETSSSTSGVDMAHAVSTTDYLGRDGILSDPYLKGSSSSNPSEDLTFHVWVAHSNSASTDVFLLVARVEIVYDAWFIEPRDPGAS